MTAGADRVRAMQFHLLAHVEELAIFGVALQVGDVGGLGRWWRTEHILEHPLAALDDRGAIGVRSDCENTSLSQQTAAIAADGDPPERGAMHIGNAIETG